MTDVPRITGNGSSFKDESDLTDQTHGVLLDIFVEEIARADVTPEGLRAATRAIRRVEAAALASGWTKRCAGLLGVVAGSIYGRILSGGRQVR